jgi:diadenosine tetraphosphate (Ap4A) HIT family hydrolase
MSTRLTWITLLGVLATSGIARADDPPPDKLKQAPRADALSHTESRSPAEGKALKREFRVIAEERDRLVRERGEVFAKIAVHKDYRGEYVLFRDEDVTAFLDLTDPQHPRYSPRPGKEDERSPRRSHILVVPNEPRENIGKTLTSDISAADLEATLKVVRAAEALAKRLGITNPQIYIKPSETVGIGYLHIHVVGERDPGVPYPPPLK